MQPRGRASLDGAETTLTFRRVYPHRRQHVWDAIATPEGLRHWLLCTSAHIDGRVGGRIELVSGAGRYRSTGKILAWDPPRLFEYEWNVAPVPEMPTGERAIFRYELIELDEGAERAERAESAEAAPGAELTEGAGATDRADATSPRTELRITYRRLTAHTARGFLPGLHAFLDRLEAQLDGRELPDWFARFDELKAVYPEWSGHASPAGK